MTEPYFRSFRFLEIEKEEERNKVTEPYFRSLRDREREREK